MPEVTSKVSVIIPHYNMHSFLPDAVESVINQDYENIELIVVDDGSDESLKREEFTVDSVEFKLFKIEHGGKAKAVNKGFEEATGEYIAILDADDRLPKSSLSDRVKILEQNNPDLVIGNFEVWYDGKKQSTRRIDEFSNQPNSKIEQALLANIISPFHQNAMLFNRSLLSRVGDMDPMMLRGQDKDFAIRLLEKSSKTAFLKESVYIYNRYDRPLSKRLYNRCVGMKYKLLVISRHAKGWRRIIYLGWGVLVESAKLVHDLFGIYKK